MSASNVASHSDMDRTLKDGNQFMSARNTRVAGTPNNLEAGLKRLESGTAKQSVGKPICSVKSPFSLLQAGSGKHLENITVAPGLSKPITIVFAAPMAESDSYHADSTKQILADDDKEYDVEFNDQIQIDVEGHDPIFIPLHAFVPLPKIIFKERIDFGKIFLHHKQLDADLETKSPENTKFSLLLTNEETNDVLVTAESTNIALLSFEIENSRCKTVIKTSLFFNRCVKPAVFRSLHYSKISRPNRRNNKILYKIRTKRKI